MKKSTDNIKNNNLILAVFYVKTRNTVQMENKKHIFFNKMYYFSFLMNFI